MIHERFGALECLPRAGVLVKGVLYMVIGVIALQVASRAGERVTGTRGAPITVLGPPFGRTLLLVAAVGLFRYAAWRILQNPLNPDRLGRDWRGLGTRVGFVAGGVVHAAFGWRAVRLYRGLSARLGSSAEREVATEALRWPLGDWLVVLAGNALIGFAVHQVYAAITSRLERNLDVEQMRREAGAWTISLSRFGVAARAVVLALLGWAIAVGAWSRVTSGVGSTTSSLRTLAAQSGAWASGSSARQRQGSWLRCLRDDPRALHIQRGGGPLATSLRAQRVVTP